MTRYVDPLAVVLAQREGQLQRLMSTGMSRNTAERWERAWFARASQLGLAPTAWDYWERGMAWITEQRSTRNAR